RTAPRPAYCRSSASLPAHNGRPHSSAPLRFLRAPALVLIQDWTSTSPPRDLPAVFPRLSGTAPPPEALRRHSRFFPPHSQTARGPRRRQTPLPATLSPRARAPAVFPSAAIRNFR